MELVKNKQTKEIRYLSFEVGHEQYGLEILSVKELMGLIEITPIPQTPEFIKGVINLRGKIIPVIDLRIMFRSNCCDYNKKTCIIVIDTTYSEESLLMGLIVDTILDVVSIPDEKISQSSYINTKIKSEYIRGIAETAEGIKILLDVNKILNTYEIESVKRVETQVHHNISETISKEQLNET